MWSDTWEEVEGTKIGFPDFCRSEYKFGAVQLDEN